MRKLLPILGGLALLAGPAMAQDCSAHYPPDPLASMSATGSCNSLPRGAATAQFPTFGGNLVTTRVGPAGRSHASQVPGITTFPATPRQDPTLQGAE